METPGYQYIKKNARVHQDNLLSAHSLGLSLPSSLIACHHRLSSPLLLNAIIIVDTLLQVADSAGYWICFVRCNVQKFDRFHQGTLIVERHSHWHPYQHKCRYNALARCALSAIQKGETADPIIITLSIWWIKATILKASTEVKVKKTRAAWIENNSMADSCITNIMRGNMLLLVAPKICWPGAKAPSTSWNTLLILDQMALAITPFTNSDTLPLNIEQ